MSVELAAVIAFGVAGAVSVVSTPFAVRVAQRTSFLDHPRGYHKHAASTPLLGGAAVLVGFLLAAVAVGGFGGRYWVILTCASLLWVLGTIDDRVAVSPRWRLLAETGGAIALWVVGLGWNTSLPATSDLVLTVIWVVGLTNAFNLMDNLDGACGTVGCVCAAGMGTLGAVHGQAALAGLGFALAGASAGFLRWNLARPARIFLGDGGSMPIGFLVAALAMATARHMRVGDANVLAAALLAGLPILDTALVSVSRMRRGVTLMTGGRDHLTHRLLVALGTPRRVAITLTSIQAALCAFAIVGDQLGSESLTALAIFAIFCGLVAIALLDTARWRPAGIAVGPRLLPAHGASAHSSVGVDSG